MGICFDLNIEANIPESFRIFYKATPFSCWGEWPFVSSKESVGFLAIYNCPRSDLPASFLPSKRDPPQRSFRSSRFSKFWTPFVGISTSAEVSIYFIYCLGLYLEFFGCSVCQICKLKFWRPKFPAPSFPNLLSLFLRFYTIIPYKINRSGICRESTPNPLAFKAIFVCNDHSGKLCAQRAWLSRSIFILWAIFKNCILRTFIFRE